MTKIISALSAVFLAMPLLAYSPETITHDVKKDKLIKRGVIAITTRNIVAGSFTMELKYSVVAKLLFFEKVLEGTKAVELPIRYLSPYGYDDLEEAGRISDENITAIHLGRKDLPNHYDCHVVKIVPKKDTNWDGIFTYCQDIPSTGFARIQMNMRNIPYVGRHTVYSEVRE